MKNLNKKLRSLSPKFKKEIQELLSNINQTIDFLYEAATKDEKTGLYNMKFFNSLFDIELERAKRGGKLSLAIFDIDNFKQINSRLGHIEADKILFKIAQILKNNLRKSDVLARFGGEEFIVLLPLTSKDKTKKVAERIRKEIENNFKGKVTISIGLTEYKKKDTKTKIKERADKALFKAKEKGRNRVEVN